ncbi:DUF726-domain-containing protein [Westerdykella ornata]|uniref:DUF726-domain-containing protein n=1 Tax=Westerdykella ornata TaxID=318751 RepID=A0A6A6JP57_WESOR|nr:DUF726-domain-containing protein [Westerdykella ornata]KAF2277688.1 DUF726-domain-containing protein [Westerdykella ornata]
MATKSGIPSWQRATSSQSSPTGVESTSKPEQSQPEKQSTSPPTTGTENASQTDAQPDNQTLLKQASRFLEDPAIRDAPREKKVAFLESRGVKADDIETLLAPAKTENKEESPEGAKEGSKTSQTSAKPKPDAPKPRDIPPIVTYPEFLAQPAKPPPLITTERLLNTAYITGGLMATMYGLSKYIIAPMAQTLAEARHDFASHTKEKLDDLNSKLRDVVTVDPATKPKSSIEIVDDMSETDSDPTELFHRDVGTQTTPTLSRRPSRVESPEDDTSTVVSQERRLKILKSHLEEIEDARKRNTTSSDALRTKLSDLSSYLTEMSYQNQYYSGMGGLYGGTYGLPRMKDGKEDQVEVLKADIRAVKGVLLSARMFPPAGLRPAGRLGSYACVIIRRLGSYPMASSLTSHLPFGASQSSPHSSKDDETSLTTLLSADQCADLTFLIATVIATMRKSLLDTFTAEELPSPESAARSEEEALGAAPSNAAEADVEKEEKLRKEREEREEDARRELARPEVQELKREMLKYFDEWRGSVIRRIGEVVNKREEATEQSRAVSEKKVEEAAQRQETGMTSLSDVEGKKETEDAMFSELYPPFETELVRLEERKRALILHSLVLILLSLEHYSGHSRILLLQLTSSLHLRLSVLKKDEEAVAKGLLEAAHQQMNADAETKRAAEASSTARKWKVGLASVAGAALIGVTGGLAAPVLAAGVGTVMGGLGLGATAAAGYLGTLASSSVLVGGLFGAYGARMTGRAMDDYAREVEDFCFIPIHQHHRPRKVEKEFRRLRVAIAISGWLTSKEEVVSPWRYIDSSIEGFALRYELEAMLKLGNSMETFVKSYAWNYTKGQIIKRTVFRALYAGLWPLSLLKVASVLDNPFSVAKYRADKAGEVLAEALINKVQGERPVTLVGYSLGARLIFSCLQTLARRKAFGLVEHVALLGAPAPSDALDWRRVRSVVSGRVVNVFSTNDYILAFLYRTSSIQLGVAGLQPVLGVHGVQNVDVSEVVSGHLRYRYLTGSILKKIGFEDIDLDEVEREEGEMRVMEEIEKHESERHEKGVKSEEEQKKEMEEEVRRKNDRTIMEWAMEKTNIGGIWGGKEGGKDDNEVGQTATKQD